VVPVGCGLKQQAFAIISGQINSIKRRENIDLNGVVPPRSQIIIVIYFAV
jgi:hypothetical protein